MSASRYGVGMDETFEMQKVQQPVVIWTTGAMTVWPSHCPGDCRCETCRPDIFRIHNTAANYAPPVITLVNTAGANT